MRLPDAHRGYVNAIVAINEARFGRTLDGEPLHARHDKAGLRELRSNPAYQGFLKTVKTEFKKSPAYQSFLAKVKSVLAARGTRNGQQPYSLGAWNLTGLPFNEETGTLAKIAPPDINGPTLVMCAMGLLDEQIPEHIRRNYKQGFFDDSGRITSMNVHFSDTGLTLLNSLEIGIRQKLDEYDRTGTIKHSPTVNNS